jgi:hypothetical protein
MSEVAYQLHSFDQKKKYLQYKTIYVQNNAQHHDPQPKPNDWHKFWPTLVFAGSTFKIFRDLTEFMI